MITKSRAYRLTVLVLLSLSAAMLMSRPIIPNASGQAKTTAPDPKVNINCKSGIANPQHRPTHGAKGVIFIATDDCTLLFKNAAVFGMSSAPLKKGPNPPLPVKVDKGQTDYCVEGAPCPSKKKGKGPKTGPNDITVP